MPRVPATSSVHRVRLADVAREARVSHVTVSMVLNNKGGRSRVSAATAERIRRIARRLNYRPNMAARQMSGQQSMLVGAVIDSMASDYCFQALITLEQFLAENGYRLLVGYLHDNMSRMAAHIDDFLAYGVAGAVCMSHTYPEFGEQIPSLMGELKHTVFIDQPLTQVANSWVCPNYESASYQVTSHLMRLGRRRISLVRSDSPYRSLVQTEKGYCRAMAEAGLPVEESLIWRGQMGSIDDIGPADRCLDEILPARPDAIVALSDQAAMWMIRCLFRRGIRVPDEMALASAARARMGRPALPSITSVDLQGARLGVAAGDLLLRSIRGETEPDSVGRQVFIEPVLEIGESCGSHSFSLLKEFV